jgi:hypothetical protein
VNKLIYIEAKLLKDNYKIIVMTTKPENVTRKICSKCELEKSNDKFYERGYICRDCNNLKRRIKYNENEELRKKLIQNASNFKHNKVIERQKLKEEEQLKIGIENKLCKYCDQIKLKSRFRHNRLKCKDCERDEPLEKFKRYIRTRIYNCLRYKNKTKHAIEYLGCSSDEYFKWIFNYNENYNLENHGKEWHIDHVIPLSRFNLDNEEQQLIAFNWRNTMPLSCEENLLKNNKIIKSQVEQQYKKLLEYHTENNLDLPQEYIDLFAKHLDAGSPLEPN